MDDRFVTDLEFWILYFITKVERDPSVTLILGLSAQGE